MMNLPIPKLSETEVLIDVKVTGVNMIETYQRSGVYPVKFDSETGSGLGTDCCGVVEKLGEKVKTLKIGDRVAVALGPLGAYSNKYITEESKCIKVPEGISDEICASSFLKGMTARYLAKDIGQLKKGMSCIVYAAAGGTGTILTQWAKHLGAEVIAVTSTDAKAKIAKENGADHVILSSENVVEKIKQIYPKGVDVAFDSIGKGFLISSRYLFLSLISCFSLQ